MNETDPSQVFRTEAADLLDTIEHSLLDLESRPGDTDIIAKIFRALHTLKGSGAMFGFSALSCFAHHFETAFDQIRKGAAVASPDVIATVLQALDHLRALTDGQDVPIQCTDRLIGELNAAMQNAKEGSGSKAGTSPRSKWKIHFRLFPDAFVNGTRPLALLDELRALGPCEITAVTDGVPPLDALNPTESYLAWTVNLETAQPRTAIEDVFVFAADNSTLSIEAAENPVKSAAGTGPVPVDQTAGRAAPGTQPANDPGEKPTQTQADSANAWAKATGFGIRVPAQRLDELMNRVGELVIAQSRLKQISTFSSDVNLHSVAEEIERLASELRDSMMSVRMVPISQLFGRFRRLIHDLARDTGKPIEFHTDGETTELDKTVIERLADPLIHLIRNAADHGLESAAERIAAGKPQTGTVFISARQAGNEVVITVSDDGRGIDVERVRDKAEKSGLIAPGEHVNEQELLQLLFQPGFSTAEKVTDLSGRGVGMDVVKRTIEALRGVIDITTARGKGSEVALRIPLTLAIIDGLLVRVGTGRYVIPLSSVEECVELTTEEDARSTGRCFLTLREQLVPFIRLRHMFETGTPPDRYQKIVVVSTGNDRVGLVVDQILGDHQTVIKPLSRFHAGIGTFSGATILGDGGVALILDVPHLVAAGQRLEERLRAAG